MLHSVPSTYSIYARVLIKRKEKTETYYVYIYIIPNHFIDMYISVYNIRTGVPYSLHRVLITTRCWVHDTYPHELLHGHAPQ